jgi:hypothetical protein
MIGRLYEEMSKKDAAEAEKSAHTLVHPGFHALAQLAIAKSLLADASGKTRR